MSGSSGESGAALPLGTSAASRDVVITDAPVAPQLPVIQMIDDDEEEEEEEEEEKEVHIDKRLKARNEWLANNGTTTYEDAKANVSQRKSYSARERFLMDQSACNENEKSKLYVSESNKCASGKFGNLNENDNSSSRRKSVTRTSNIILNGSDLSRDQEIMSYGNMSKTNCVTKQPVINTTALLTGNGESNQNYTGSCTESNESLKDHVNGNRPTDGINSQPQTENGISNQVIEDGSVNQTSNKVCENEDVVLSNGWPKIKDYQVECKGENNAYTLVESNQDSKSNSGFNDEESSLENHFKQESAKENEVLLENLVREKKESKVSKFVRMFNKKETVPLESKDRAPVRRNSSRVWGMCMQVQSPSFDDEYYKECSYKKDEKDSVKSEPLIDNNHSDFETSLEIGLNGSRTSSSFPEAEAASYRSLDLDREPVISKKKNSNAEADSKVGMSLIRSFGGRRSFDKPQRPNNFPKKCGPPEEAECGNGLVSRTSKTLPATPTSNAPKMGADSASSHPFYRRFYSHCMVLPTRKKKKDHAKKNGDVKGPDILLDTAPICQIEEVESRDLDSESIFAKGKSCSIQVEEPSDSPKKIPVVDDLLLEILENVNIVEHEIDDKEMKRKSIIYAGSLDPFDCSEFRNKSSLSTDDASTATGESGIVVIDDGATNDSLEASDWSGAPSLTYSPTRGGFQGITRSNSRISSLISKFEQGT
ncbi:uncharacterized protein LOC135201691 [Macrobrachium nipponense]|uniref:uncharacterized protein LOC135201691 n=1 Tax=Macrobrachium nipponense TaxID=159736 RepID=UPI0030C88F11